MRLFDKVNSEEAGWVVFYISLAVTICFCVFCVSMVYVVPVLVRPDLITAETVNGKERGK